MYRIQSSALSRIREKVESYFPSINLFPDGEERREERGCANLVREHGSGDVIRIIDVSLQSLTRQRPREGSQTRPESRSFPPSVIAYMSRSEVGSSPENGQEEEESFFERPPPPPPPLPPPLPPPPSQQSQSQIDQSIGGLPKDEEDNAKVADLLDSAGDRDTSEELVR